MHTPKTRLDGIDHCFRFSFFQALFRPFGTQRLP
jgi:hypothetical protein